MATAIAQPDTSVKPAPTLPGRRYDNYFFMGMGLLMAATVFGFLARMGLVVAALWLVKGRSWVNFAALAVVLLTTHLGLLFWETRYLSMSLAFPGLRPRHEQRD